MLDSIVISQLIAVAQEARKHAYAPYSNFQVGAAVLCNNGRIVGGCNIENASYGLCNCAERTAIFKAISEGECEFRALAVIADTNTPVAPCGACRQVLAEFGVEIVIMSNLSGERLVVPLAELLPYSFSKSDLLEDGYQNE